MKKSNEMKQLTMAQVAGLARAQYQKTKAVPPGDTSRKSEPERFDVPASRAKKLLAHAKRKGLLPKNAKR